MLRAIERYTSSLHGRWPAGTVEKLPQVAAGGETSVPDLCVVGDLTGIPLLEFSSDTGGLKRLSASAADPSTLLGTLAITLEEPGFYYSTAYRTLGAAFGVRRIRRRKTPYVRAQTLSLMAVQIVALFLLPYILLPPGPQWRVRRRLRKDVCGSPVPDCELRPGSRVPPAEDQPTRLHAA